MATLSLKPLAIAQVRDGAPSYEKIAPSTSATFVAGDLAVKTDNALIECGANPTVITHYTSTTQAGIIPGDTKMVVAKVRQEDTYEMSAWSATPSLATIADTALDAQADYGITFNTVSGVSAWTMDIDKIGAVNARVRLLDRVDGSADVYPRVRVRFLGSIVQGNT